MTDQSMIEKVARAIYEEDDPWHKVWPWPDLQEDQTEPEKYRQVAIAAIKAMGEPTMEMLEQGGWALLNQIEGSEAMEAQTCYRAMIDAALKGEG